MGQAIHRCDQITVSRRPKKVLRQKSIQIVNLGTYDRETAKSSPAKVTPRQNKTQRVVADYRQFKEQQSGATNAVNDAAFNKSRLWRKQLHGVSRDQLTIGILSCLFIGSLVGYRWSFMLNPVHLSTNNVQNERPDSETALEQAGLDDVLTEVKVQTTPGAIPRPDVVTNREQQHQEDQLKLRSQIGSLQGENIDLQEENSDLKNEIHELNLETTEQSRDLLKLELEIFSLQSQSEPPTETRIVYNFVNVPIGGTTESQNEDYDNSHLIYDDPESYIDGDGSSRDIQAKLMSEWEKERAQYNDEGRVVYDPETGFYVKDNYGGEQEEFEEYEENEQYKE